MLNKTHEQLITRYFEEVWNRGDLDVLDEIIALTYINHTPGAPNPLPGPAGLKPIVAGMRKAFPDINYVIENMVVSDSQVAVHTIMSGTHTGDLFGLAPTFKAVKINQMQIGRIVDHKIVV